MNIHSPPISAEVKNEWSYASVSHMPSWREQEQLHLLFPYFLKCPRLRPLVLIMSVILTF
jgi:hypothetical protein